MFPRRVRIKLNGGRDQMINPGGIVSGIVEYKSPTDDCLSSLTIDLRGVSMVTAPNNPTRKEPLELFHIRETLYQGNRVFEHHKTHVWPFELIFPATTRADLTGLDTLANDDKFDERPHQMPPSMGSDETDHSHIKYRMHVIAKPGHGAYGGGVASHDEPCPYSIEYLRCLPDVLPGTVLPALAPSLEQTLLIKNPSTKGLFRRVQSAVSSSDQQPMQPVHTFKVIANLPSMIILGQPIPISFLVRYVADTAGMQGVPACTHKSTSVAINAKTYSRCIKIPYREAWIETREKRLGTDYASGGIPLDASVQVRKFSSVSLMDWLPSFRSYSISRFYDLRVDITVRFEGQKQDFIAQFEVPDITVVRQASQEPRLAGRLTDDPPQLLHLLSPRYEDEELPPYEP